MSDTYKRRLWVGNRHQRIMFAVEMTAGQLARSQALQADALDFFADAVTYGISLAVIGASLKNRSLAAAVKGGSLFLMGLWVFGATLWRVFYQTVPEARSWEPSVSWRLQPIGERIVADELQGRRRQCSLRLVCSRK